MMQERESFPADLEVLVVDDQQSQRDIVTENFESFGFKVTAFGRWGAVKDELDRRVDKNLAFPEFAAVDMNFENAELMESYPEREGAAIVEQIRTICERHSRPFITCIGFSTRVGEQGRQYMLEAGAQDFLDKQQTGDLNIVVHRVLSLRREITGMSHIKG